MKGVAQFVKKLWAFKVNKSLNFMSLPTELFCLQRKLIEHDLVLVPKDSVINCLHVKKKKKKREM